LALDHKSGCTDLIEGTGAVSRVTEAAIKLDLRQDALYAKTVTKK
jgi:hypothetical protein